LKTEKTASDIMFLNGAECVFWENVSYLNMLHHVSCRCCSPRPFSFTMTEKHSGRLFTRKVWWVLANDCHKNYPCVWKYLDIYAAHVNSFSLVLNLDIRS